MDIYSVKNIITCLRLLLAYKINYDIIERFGRIRSQNSIAEKIKMCT